MVTPWQARFALAGFLAIGAAIAANLLLLQERRTPRASMQGQPARAVPETPVRRPLATQNSETKSPRTATPSRQQTATSSSGKSSAPRPVERAKSPPPARKPATTAATR